MSVSEGNSQPVEPALPSIYTAAHELKAPLVLMRQLSLELKDSSPQDAVTIERLLLTVDRSLRLVDQLTRTARLEDALFDSEPLNARVVCQAVTHELAPLAKQYNQTMLTRVSRQSGMVVAHRSLLVALLVNLCDNALTHNAPGEKVILSAMAREGGVEFAVRDHGPQLSHKAFLHLRKQFGNGPMPLSERPRSSGLGLWIASRFAEAMGGELRMVRHHDKGITISVVLPYSNQLALL